MIKAIPTIYNGYKFRSRLEARWAVFFDALGIKYEYEKEGYDLGEAGYYLPDFWLPEQKCWVEIKGQYPGGEELSKAYVLAEFTGSRVYVFHGQIPIGDYGEEGTATECDTWGGDECMAWCVCTCCRKLGIGYKGNGNPPRMCHHPGDHYGEYDHKILRAAYDKARQARFEHGKHGN